MICLLSIIQLTREEYRKDNLCVRDYNLTIFGIPIYSARFTSTNNQALKLLTEVPERKTISGYTTKK